MGRHDGFSPRKDVRRSHRARATVYKSLDENGLGMPSPASLRALVDAANVRRDRELREVFQAAQGTRYPLRTRGAAFMIETTEDESDHHEEENIAKRTRRHSGMFGDDDDVAGPSAKRRRSHNESPIMKRPPRRRSNLVESDDEERGSSHAKDEDEEEGNEDREVSMYERVKRRSGNVSNHSTPASGLRATRRSKRGETPVGRKEKNEEDEEDKEEEEEEHVDEVEEEEEDEDSQTRQYPLRRTRKTVERYTATVEKEEEEEDEPRQYPLRRERRAVERYADIVSKNVLSEQRAARNLRRLERMERRTERHRKREFRHRHVRSDSDSTGGSDSEEGGSKRKGRRDDEERFDHRKERSMAKARNRFMPINLNDRDLSTSQQVIRERMRQTGASCSDIDPMTIDQNVFFDQVGGLGTHIQTLKEVVLFPMLYPDIFSRFNINPPKGVVFYGPPGTGKTLVARALANECSRGAKKVAFFMRKGADCLSKWVGESERQLRLLFDQAYAMRPSIIFFDEIDGLAPVRSSRQDQIHSSIVSTLLALMDGLDSRGEVVVIGATNRLDTLDPALRRPGRFDRELKFSLPDVSARLQILDIHTKEWSSSKPSETNLQWLAESTSGYCGADLKFLCTEAVLIALRERYPHIYMSKERLAVDPNEMQIDQRHLKEAMRRITPASRRDLSIPSRPLDDRTSILLLSTLNRIMNERIPSGYRNSSSVSALSGACELEQVVRALEAAPVVPAVRLLLSGCDQSEDAGQSSFVLPALLSKLDHLPIFSLAVGKLFADGRPEEALAQCMQSALRAASTTPAILLLPNVDQWYEVVPPSVSHMLATALENLTGFSSLLFLATCDGVLTETSTAVKSLFRAANAYEVSVPSKEERRAYFNHIIIPALEPPKVFDPSIYPAPPVATTADVGKRKLSEKEAKELKKVHESQLRQFRIFLRDMLARLMRDRRFHIFNNPVDVEDAHDYYEIIEKPMCMTDMMGKIDKEEYTHPDQFLTDIRLIMRNALEYNPNRNQEDKTIRHHAVALRDMADALFDVELDMDFVEKMQDTERLLKEAGIEVEKEELPFAKTPAKFTRSAAAAGYVNEVEILEKVEDDGEVQVVHCTSQSVTRTPQTGRRRARFGSRRKGSSMKPKKEEEEKEEEEGEGKMEEDEYSREPNASDESQGGEEKIDKTEGEKEKNKDDAKMEDDSAERESAESGETPEKEVERGENEEGMERIEKKTVLIDEDELKNVTTQIASRTKYWPVPELERLAAALIHEIDQTKKSWDRKELPATLLDIATNWHYKRTSTTVSSS